MKQRFVWKLSFLLSVVGVLLQHARAAIINNTPGEGINGQYLLDVGRRINDPMLQAIGIAIKNLHPHSCGVWTSWSPCAAITPGYFGIKDRTRKCGNEPDIVNMETDSSICRIGCPLDYDETTNGFCVKMIHNFYKSYVDAIDHCKADGGYLIHIDSQAKYDDITNLNASFKSSYIRIDGRRKDTSSPWMFEYGRQAEFFKWGPGQPANKPKKLCMIINWSDKRMYDFNCQESYRFICEILM